MTKPDDISAEELGVEVRGAVARLYRRLRSEKGEEALGDTHVSVLNLLARQGPHTLSELSDVEHVTAPSMNQTVNYLQDAGWVDRQKDPNDGRKILITASPKGTAVVLELKRRRHAWLGERLETLTHDERRTLLEASRILRNISDS
jgi:DNA-binding MarR family transcriptional regulator